MDSGPARSSSSLHCRRSRTRAGLFADQDGAGGCESTGDFRVGLRHAIVEQGARCRCANPRSIDVVFDRDRDSVQRPAQRAGALLAVELARTRERVLTRDGDERVDLRIEGSDSGEALFRKLSGRGRSALDTRGRFDKRQ